MPMTEKAGVPAMALSIFGIGAAVLASFGVDRFGSELSSRWTRRLTLGVLSFALVTYIVIFATYVAKQLSWPTDDRLGITAFAALLLAGILNAWRTANVTRNQALALLFLVMLLELGVRFSSAEKAEQPDEKEVYQAESGLKLFVSPAAFPRVWPAHAIIPVTNAGEGDVLIRDHLNDLQWKVFMTNPAPELAAHLQICPNVEDAVSIQRYEPHRVYLRAQMGCDGMVVLSDTYYPGWVATVDGNEAPIYQVDNALRGVLVPT